MKLTTNLLPLKKTVRNGRPLSYVSAIVNHWWADFGERDSLNGVRNWWINKTTHGSAHILIDRFGDGMVTIPINEVAFHCGSDKPGEADNRPYTYKARKKFGKYCTDKRLSPNMCTIGIEMQNVNPKGDFTDETLDLSSKVNAFLALYNNLSIQDIETHNTIVGWKDCPRLWTNKPRLFDRFLQRVEFYMTMSGEEKYTDFYRPMENWLLSRQTQKE
jgi:N-acetylmuramoyl-L-alanine amidase